MLRQQVMAATPVAPPVSNGGSRAGARWHPVLRGPDPRVRGGMIDILTPHSQRACRGWFRCEQRPWLKFELYRLRGLDNPAKNTDIVERADAMLSGLPQKGSSGQQR